MVVSIRRVSESSVSHICLLTAAAGYSAEDRHEYGEFTGLVYSVLPRKYERVAEETWWPALRTKCPVEGPEKISEKEADFRYISLFKNIYTAVEEHIAFSPPYIHTDILRGYRRQGWGKKLIEKAAECLHIDGLWVQRTRRQSYSIGGLALRTSKGLEITWLTI